MSLAILGELFPGKELDDALADKGMVLLAKIDGPTALRIVRNRLQPSGEWNLLQWFFTRVLLEHLVDGHPLELPPEVIAVLDAADAGTITLESPLASCGGCGYVYPRQFQVCLLCGDVVAIGARARRLASSAGLN